MKKSDHKTTMQEVCEFLLAGPQYASDIGDHFWPDKSHHGPSRGGPCSSAVAASWMLGRMRVKGYVRQTFDRHPKWELTDEGHAFLMAVTNPT